MIDYSQNLRRRFADELYHAMENNPNIYVLTGDLGYRVLDEIRRDFPNRFLNTGAAEQALMGIAVGLALEGKIPVVYSITPFLLYRPFETIRNYIDNEKIPVKLIGSGRDKDYALDGFSHWSCEDKEVMKILKNIKSSWPKSADEVTNIMQKVLSDDKPWYVNLKR
jgi:transketolase